jgi:hypothetical protein
MDSFIIGQYVIIRSSPSGCWAGNLKSMEGQTVELTNARRLWRWWAASGVSLSGVAAAGLHPKHLDVCRIAEPVSAVLVHEVCEVLLATEIAKSSIESQKALAS